MSDNDIGHMTKKRISQGAYRQLRSIIESMDGTTERNTNINQLLIHKGGAHGASKKALKVSDGIRLITSNTNRSKSKSFLTIRNDTFNRCNIRTNPDGFEDEGIVITSVSKQMITYVLYTKHSMLRAFQRDPLFLKLDISGQIECLFQVGYRVMSDNMNVDSSCYSFDVELSTLTVKVSRAMNNGKKQSSLIVKTFIPNNLSQERTIND